MTTWTYHPSSLVHELPEQLSDKCSEGWNLLVKGLGSVGPHEGGAGW